MTGSPAAAALLVGAAATGLLLVVSGLVAVPVPPRRPRATRPVPWMRIVAALVGGLLAVVLTRWPVAALAGGTVGWLVAGRVRRGPSAREMTEAIALWCEMLRDAVGTDRGLESVIAATAPSAPAVLRPAVVELAEGLGAYGQRHRAPQLTLVEALDRFCDRVAHPAADLVATSLRLSAATSQSELPRVLTALAHAAYAEAESARRIDVAREQPKTSMRIVTGVVVGFVALLVAVSGDYLDPYSTPTGQLVLAGVCVWWVAAVLWMRRMSRPARAVRFLARRGAT